MEDKNIYMTFFNPSVIANSQRYFFVYLISSYARIIAKDPQFLLKSCHCTEQCKNNQELQAIYFIVLFMNNDYSFLILINSCCRHVTGVYVYRTHKFIFEPQEIGRQCRTLWGCTRAQQSDWIKANWVSHYSHLCVYGEKWSAREISWLRQRSYSCVFPTDNPNQHFPSSTSKSAQSQKLADSVKMGMCHQSRELTVAIDRLTSLKSSSFSSSKIKCRSVNSILYNISHRKNSIYV